MKFKHYLSTLVKIIFFPYGGKIVDLFNKRRISSKEFEEIPLKNPLRIDKCLDICVDIIERKYSRYDGYMTCLFKHESGGTTVQRISINSDDIAVYIDKIASYGDTSGNVTNVYVAVD